MMTTVKAPARWLRRRLVSVDYAAEFIEFHTFLRKRNPTYIYSMGKTGSTAITHMLRHDANHPVFKVHSLRRDETERRIASEKQAFGASHRARGYWRYRFAMQDLKWRSDQPRDLISMVREPVARAVSGQFYAARMSEGGSPDWKREEQALAIEQSLEDWLASPDWFEHELAHVTGIDIYQRAVDSDHQVFAAPDGRFRVLLLRQEDLASSPEQIRRFLGLPQLPVLTTRNDALRERGSEQYQDFLSWWRPPRTLLDSIYASRQVTHFYSPTEIARFRSRWLGPSL